MSKPTPYSRLLDDFRAYARSVKRARRKTMWTYAAKDIRNGTVWDMASLAERVRAADQLGYDVALRWTNEGLTVEYVARPGSLPCTVESHV